MLLQNNRFQVRKMVKKFIDIDKVLKASELNKEEKFYDSTMREMPKHNKYGEIDMNGYVIYRKAEFIIIEVHDSKRTGYIVQNTKKQFPEGHTHIKSLEMAKQIIKNVIGHKTPKTHNQYLLESHIRISNDEKYIEFLKELKKTRQEKEKKSYRNINSKKVKK